MEGRRSLGLALAMIALGCGGAQVLPEDPEVVALRGELGNTFVTAGEAADIVSRIRIDSLALGDATRAPINLALVVDTSGSMSGAPISDARNASLALLEAMRPDDRLAVIAFHSTTEVLLPSTRLGGADVGALRSAIARMDAQGTTDLANGLRVGLEELMRSYVPEGINRVVLLSDGVPNDAAQIRELAQAAGERGIRITALGLGLDYDETLLAHIAQHSGGRFHYVQDSAQVAALFRNEVLRFERVLARNLVLEVRPGPGVRIDGVVGQPFPGPNGAVSVALGDLSEGEHRDVIVRMHAEPRRAGASVELIDAVLRFEDGVRGAGSLERRLFLGARATDAQADLERGRNAEVEQAAARMLAAVTTVQAVELARRGDLEQAREILDRAATRAMEFADETGSASVRAQASQMRVLEEALPSVAPAEARPAAARADSERVVRDVHSEAMEALQTSDR